MSLQTPQQVDFIPLDGRVLTSGGSLGVTDGVLAVVNNKKVSSNGREVVSTFAGLPKDTEFQILLGKTDVPVTRSTTNKPHASLPFKLSEVVDFTVEVPKKGIKVDDFIIGYNGKNGTELTLKEHSQSRIELTLCGDPMMHLGYETGEVTVAVNLTSPYVDEDGNPVGDDAVTMHEIVENAVKEFNKMTLLGGAPITDYVDIIPVNSENEAILGGTSYTFYNLTVPDLGDKTAEARVQAQYPTYKVVKTDRSVNDEESIYTILAPTGTSLSDYEVSLAQKLKGCADCPAGYDELEAGVVYSIEIEDDGADLTTTIDDVPGFVTGTVVKISQNGGVGVYTVVVDNALTDAEIATFKAASAIKGTAVFSEPIDVLALCENTDTTDYTWTTGSTCTAIAKNFRITVADDECGEDVLADLQANYPNLTIVADTPNLSRTITLTGTSGTANIVIDGVNYLATFASDLTTTAANFDTANSTALTALGIEVTNASGVLTIVAPVDSFPVISVANVSGNLAGTLGTVAASGTEIAGLCQSTFRTSVLTNVVCSECSDEFRALFEAEAPKPFRMNVWEESNVSFSDTAKMGIRVRGKEFVIAGSENYRDNMPFYATSTKLKIAGGQPKMISESFNNQDRPYAVKVLSIASDAEGLGGNLWEREDKSRFYFDGLSRFEGNNYGKWLWGQETRLKPLAQYIIYSLTVNPIKHYQLVPHASEKLTYNIIVELGRHEAIETLFNKLAAAASLPAVQAFAK